MKEGTIINKINDLVELAESWGKSRNKLINNFHWIAQKQDKHSVEFDITGQSLRSIASKRRNDVIREFEYILKEID